MANITDVKLPDNSQYDLKDNVSGYASKVLSATTDDLASLTATGDLADSGKKLSDLVLKSDVKDVLNSTSTTDPLSAKQGKVLADNLAANENVYGSKNLLDLYTTLGTYGEVIVTNNNDGSITVTTNGQTVTDTQYVALGSSFTLYKGNYYASYANGTDDPVGIVDKCFCYLWIGIAACVSTNSKENRSITPQDDISAILTLAVVAGTVISTPITFYPMLRDSHIVDDTFVPYVPTNRELMSYKANGKVGAKNLNSYPYYENSKVENGITWTVNSNGSVTVSGIATGLTYLELHSRSSQIPNTCILKTGTYILTGGLSWKVSINIDQRDSSGSYTSIGTDFGSGLTFTIVSDVEFPDAARIGLSLVVESGTDLSTPVTIYPMIRIVEDTDPTFAPYAMTNRELTESLTANHILNATHSDLTVGVDFTVPSDGLLYCVLSDYTDSAIAIQSYLSNNTVITIFTKQDTTATYNIDSIYVRKGMKLKLQAATHASASFYPFIQY